VDTLLVEIEKIIVKTMISVEGELTHNYKSCQPNDKEGAMCFEILGFDIIIDDEFKPYLLEVNHAPSFN
jgi:tubulin polyglutamylase TTLL6/13